MSICLRRLVVAADVEIAAFAAFVALAALSYPGCCSCFKFMFAGIPAIFDPSALIVQRNFGRADYGWVYSDFVAGQPPASFVAA